MAKMTKEAMDLFRDSQTSKILATIDSNGMPSMAPKGSLVAIDNETLAFAEVAGGKTRTNLEVTNKVAAAAFKTAAGCQIKGTFQGFQSGGPLFDEYAQLIKQTGTSARWMSNVQEVGIIKVQEVT
ncbi:MAG: pyridoxamine 5'-phosphate oxidase family protein [Chloroflexi bacterium]|jgi:uncharacterized protein|nr:pyridoxamine 5'-phosphate oxidase family protein [Chloroflexota bacterium]